MKELPNRKPLRLREYDYNTPGAYFLTFCTHNRKNTLSRIPAEITEFPTTELTPYGEVVDRIINHLPQHLHVEIDRYVIMPNHVHLIVMVNEDAVRAIRESPLHSRSDISKTIGYIKMNASREIRERFGAADIWQRGFHDHVIRNQADYEAIAKYIYENPVKWTLDKLYQAEEN